MIKVDKDICMHCGGCVGLCPVDALTLNETELNVSDNCNECMICVKFCPVRALGV